MKKAECEKVIRHLCHQWKRESGYDSSSDQIPCFMSFKSWLQDKGYSHYLDFRSDVGADYVAEGWFDQELGQSWRN